MSTTGARIERDDIEAKFRELQGEVEIISDEAVNYAVVAGAAILVGVVVVAFWLGRRRGRRTRTVVEIRRV
ncbi:MAG: hypothetical protein R2726_23655 [Acidimicrobiales bacterium]